MNTVLKLLINCILCSSQLSFRSSQTNVSILSEFMNYSWVEKEREKSDFIGYLAEQNLISFTAVLSWYIVQEIILRYCTVIKLSSSSSRKYQLVLIAGSGHRGIDQPNQHLQPLKYLFFPGHLFNPLLLGRNVWEIKVVQEWHIWFCSQRLLSVATQQLFPWFSPPPSLWLPSSFPLSLAASTAHSCWAHLVCSSSPSPSQAGTAAAPKWELARQLLLMIPLTDLFHLLIQLSYSPPAWFPFPKHPGCSNPHSASCAPSSMHTEALLMLFSTNQFPTPPAQQLLLLSSLNLK